MSSVQEQYGESKEGAVIVAMSLLILASLLAVIWLMAYYAPECHSMQYTWCGSPPAHH